MNLDWDVHKMYDPVNNIQYRTRDIIWLKRMYFPATKVGGLARRYPNLIEGFDDEYEDAEQVEPVIKDPGRQRKIKRPGTTSPESLGDDESGDDNLPAEVDPLSEFVPRKFAEEEADSTDDDDDEESITSDISDNESSSGETDDDEDVDDDDGVEDDEHQDVEADDDTVVRKTRSSRTVKKVVRFNPETRFSAFAIEYGAIPAERRFRQRMKEVGYVEVAVLRLDMPCCESV